MEKQRNIKCESCKSSFVYKKDETWWCEKCFGYSVKLTKCPYCETINIIKYIDDYGLDVNNDSRFYEYK